MRGYQTRGESSDFPEVRYWLGIENYATAEALVSRALEEQPHLRRLWELRGTVHLAQQRYDEACDALEHASVLGPLSASAQCELAKCYLALEKPDLARTIYEHLAWADLGEAEPTEILPKVSRGLGLLGNHEMALEVCRHLTSLAPDFHPAHFGIAFYLARLERKPEELLPSLRRAFTLAPNVLGYRLNLTFVEMASGQFEEAYALVRDLCVEQLRCAFWLRHLAEVYRIAGDEDRVGRCEHQLRRVTTEDGSPGSL